MGPCSFSVDGWGCVSSLLFDLRPNYGGGNEDNGNLLQKPLAHSAALSAPDPAAGHRQPTSRPEILDPHRQDWGRLWSHKYCNFYKLEICGNLVSSKSIDAIFPNVFAHFMSLSHILGIPAILKIFIIVFVMVIMISDL